MASPEEEQAEGKDEKILARARRRFKEAIDAETENRGKELDDMKFLASTPDDNYQWPTDILAQRQGKPGAPAQGGNQPCLTINKMRPHQNQVLNEQRMNRPQIQVRPADSKASKEVAKVLNGWLRHIQVASEADLAYDTACKWQTGGGVGYFRMYTEFADPMSFEQTVVFAMIGDRFKVYMDPVGLMHHPAGKKCQWGFVIEDMSKEEYEETYPDDVLDWDLTTTGDHPSWYPNGKTTVRIAEYMEIEQADKVICQWKVPGPTTEPEIVVTVQGSPEDKKYTQAGYQKTAERKTKIPRCVWRKLTSQKVLKTKEMPTGFIPIVRVVGNEFVIDGKTLVDGMVRPAKDAQRSYNYHASKEVQVNALSPMAPITAMVEQIKGHEDLYRVANVVPMSHLPYNAVYNEDGSIAMVAAPTRIQPPMPPMAIIQSKIGADQDLKATMGQWGPSLGEPSGEKSGKAINARRTESDVGTFHYMDNLARALKYAGVIALDMASEIIDSKRIVRILGEDGEADHIIVDPEAPLPYQETVGPDGKKVKVYNFSIGKYEVTVNTGASFTTRRAEAAEFLTTAVQSAKDPATASTLTYLAMKNQDWAGAEEALTALKALLPPPVAKALEGEQEGEQQVPPQMKGMVDELKGQIGHLAGQLDAAKQALQQRDQTLKENEAELKSKNRESLVKMYEADKKAMTELVKARADVEIAKVDAVTALAQSPGNQMVEALVPALDKLLAEITAKIEALAQATAGIAQQLQTFEIASGVQQQAVQQQAPQPMQQPGAVPA